VTIRHAGNWPYYYRDWYCAQTLNEFLSKEDSIMKQAMKNFLTLLIVVSLSGCSAMTGKTAGRNVDDATVTASVKSQLVMDKTANLTRIDVDTNNGVVYLNGTVDSTEQRARAAELARRVKGVSKVVNNLQVARR
jgi:osmotically-inducible protein OsmY